MPCQHGRVLTSLLLIHAAVVSLAWCDEPQLAIEYGAPQKLAKIQDKRINEASGIARSLSRTGAFWLHNDSGDDPRLFLIDRRGKTVAEVDVKKADADDWEDVCSYRTNGENFLIVGDVGDNDRKRKHVRLYVIREPDLRQGVPGKVNFEREIKFKYEDDEHDCEAIAVDVERQEIILVTKVIKERAHVYSLPLSPTSDKKLKARLIAKISAPVVTAMDISADGRRAVLLQYVTAIEYARGAGESWAEAFRKPPRLISLPPQRQSEAICYGDDGRTLFLTSEGKSQPLWMLPYRSKGE